MDILIVRHAHAGTREAFAPSGRPDRERPLTGHGKRKFRKTLPGLRRCAPKVARIVTSPFVRAKQTAELLARAFPKAALTTLPALGHGGSGRAVVAWLERLQGGAVALVGHEPDLGRLIGLLTRGRAVAPFKLKKGGAALLRFEGPVAAGGGTLVSLLPPALLKHVR